MKKNATIILSLCALFLFYKYIAQLFPSLIGSALMKSHGYDGVMLAIMASSFYYSYTFMQVAAGLIVDRYSIKWPMFFSVLTISLMMLIFANTNNFYLMCLSRVLMGVGASFATVLYMKCAAYYTTPKTFGLISSFLATATMLGAACGSLPIGLLFQHFGWQYGLSLVAIVGLMMTTSILIILQRQTTMANQPIEPKITPSGLREVLARKNNWLLLLYSGFTFSPVAILGGLWGVPFLMEKYDLSAANASVFLTAMFIGHAIGSPFWAILSAQLNCKKELMYLANFISFLGITLIIYGNISYSITLVLFFIFGFSVGCFMLSFELCRAFNSVAMMGLSVAFINSGEGIIGSVLEPFIGQMLDTYKVGLHFSLENYQMALSILPLCFILSSIMLSFIKTKQSSAAIELNLEAIC